MSKLFEQNYSELFDKSTSYTNTSVSLHHVFLGKASLYDVCLRWLKTLYDAEKKGGESNKYLLDKLSFMVPDLKKVVLYAQTYRSISFVDDLLLKELRSFSAPERKERILLGDAGLILMAEMLVSRINLATSRALRHMSYNDRETRQTKVFSSLDELVENDPVFFQWNGISGEHHLQFRNFIVGLWRTFDMSVVEIVKSTVNDIKTLNSDRFDRRRNDRINKISDNDQKLLDNIEPLDKSEPAQVKMFKPLTKLTSDENNNGKNVWELRKEQQEKEREDVVMIVEVSKEPKNKKNKKKSNGKNKSTESKQVSKNNNIKSKVTEVTDEPVVETDAYGSTLRPDSTREWRKDDGAGKWNTKEKKTQKSENTKQNGEKKRIVSTFVLRGDRPTFKKQ